MSDLNGGKKVMRVKHANKKEYSKRRILHQEMGC
jgi:hypothetical protein